MNSATPSTHPSPHGMRVSLTHQTIGLAAAPIAWAARLVANLAVASDACLPAGPSPATATRASVGPILVAVDIIALIVALAAAAIAYRDWRLTREEKPGSHGHALDVGEGRARFLALCGVIVSLGFALATVFDLAALYIVPLCSRS